ncbi:MAG TPA: FxsA family protein [Methylophilaceae bacterium]|nr:FxsA family protein [Methylophilaceae bacterium]
MRLLFVILLAFPFLEIWLLIELGSRYGWWLIAYLALVAILGWRLLQEEKSLVHGRMAQTLMQGGTSARALFGSTKNIIAGVLLIIPGVISDVLAVILLLMPSAKPIFTNSQARATNAKAANDDIIEGEFRRED